MRTAHLVSAGLMAALAFPTSTAAQKIGGGGRASNGRIPSFRMESWLPGLPTALSFGNLPPNVTISTALISTRSTNLPIPGLAGTVRVDPSPGIGIAVPLTGRLPIPTLPASAQGTTLFTQGIIIDPMQGLVATDAVRAPLFNPVTFVGNQRQSANSISVVDVIGARVRQRLTNSENGDIEFSADRTRAYVCEPGLNRNQVTVYDLTATPIRVLTRIRTTGGIRYRVELSPDGTRGYVPIHNGVDVIDTNPSSPAYHTVINTLRTPITGSPTTIFTGPIDLAITPDGKKLYVAYGENTTFPGKTSTVGVFDLTQSTPSHSSIAVTTGGVVTLLSGLATRSRIVVSPDGAFVYAVEFGFPPGGFGVQGFTNGGLLNIISTANDTEIQSIATGGISQSDMAIDSLGENLWIPQLTVGGNLGELLRVNVDSESANPRTIRSRITVDQTPYRGGGPRGVAVTPDSSTVAVSVVEDGSHPQPLLIRYDARTERTIGPGIRVESLPGAVAIQQR